MAERQSFSPLVFDDSEILILGAIPSSSSIEKGEYYYHYANYIWDYLAEIFGTARPKSWPEKMAFLQVNHIALWDMYAYSETVGSLDKGLGEFNDLAGFLEKHPTITKVLLNGKKTTQAFYQYQKAGHLLSNSINVYPLPSTSGANTRIPKTTVLLAWKDALS
jgi:hypoxanthine-DNA glycosylase